MSASVVEMMLEMEREKSSRLEAMTKRSEAIIVALQNENQQLQQRLREVTESLQHSNQNGGGDHTQQHHVNAAEHAAQLEEKEEEIRKLQATVTSFEKEVESLVKTVQELKHSQQQQGSSGHTEPNMELAATQREVIRLTKQLRACEMSLQDALDEKETLAVKLKAAQRTAMESAFQYQSGGGGGSGGSSYTPYGIHSAITPSDKSSPGGDPQPQPVSARGGPQRQNSANVSQPAIIRKSPDRRGLQQQQGPARALSPIFRSRSPRFTSDKPQGPPQHSYQGVDDKSSAANKTRRITTQGTFSMASRQTAK